MKLAICLVLCLILSQTVSAQTNVGPLKNATANNSINTNNTLEDRFGYRADDAVPNDNPKLTATPNQYPTVGTKKYLMVVGHWTDGYRFDTEKLWKQAFSDDPLSFRSYIRAASKGKLLVDGQMITAEFGTPACGIKSISELAAAAAKTQNISYDYLISFADCGGGAVAWRPGNAMEVYGQPPNAHVFNHEMGHSLGFSHGHTYSNCPVADDVIQAPDQCTVIGFSDTGDSVSGGETLYPAHNRWFSGWLNNSQIAVINNTGLYRLGVLGQEGPQLYLINRPIAPNQIALEFRQPTPFDNFSPDDNRMTGVWIRYTSMEGSVFNFQLDATPETSTATDSALQPARTLEDATAKVKIKVCETDKTGATLAVALNGQGLPDCTTTVPAPIIEAPVSDAKTGLKPVIGGTSWPGARIVVSSTETPVQTLGEAVADAHGQWSLQLAKNLDQGRHFVTAQQFFDSRNSASTPERGFDVVDIEVFPALIESPADNVQTGIRPVITGTGIPGATVTLLEYNQPNSPLATTVVDGYGKWSV
ncbi:hypothetical protein, partial [Pseudomonas mandelii]|uniref:hypothetical protein n=1 Tax=Pseudomonas mandelii TaxID=75612 RepID=UPI003CFD89FF